MQISLQDSWFAADNRVSAGNIAATFNPTETFA
jgi:hypothetical protein